MARSAFPLRDSIHGDIDFARVYPVWSRFVLPGDVWKINSSLLIRFMPMTTPPLTRNDVRVRFFFVPLRLIEEDTELIITGSKNGKFNPTVVVPKFLDVFDAFASYWRGQGVSISSSFPPGSLFDWIYGLAPRVVPGALDSFIGKDSSPALYWLKAFSRCLFDYYRDENFSSFDDFDHFWLTDLSAADWPDLGMQSGDWNTSNFFTNLRKDGYVTSSLPWQLKGIAPTISTSSVLNGTVTFTGSPGLFSSYTFDNSDKQSRFLVPGSSSLATLQVAELHSKSTGASYAGPLTSDNSGQVGPVEINNAIKAYLSKNSISGDVLGGFNMAQFREMAAQTRIFERLARTGSRYVEYLRANFGIAPDDGTLQRAQYLGGYKMPIVTTEVLQTSEGDNPVGTMRGHGITSGGDRIHTAYFREFGIVLAMLDVRPHLEWTQGVDREKTYKSRWDFYNPSFANLSEQQVRNGEVYFSDDGKNDDPFGYVPYGQELRTSRTRMAGQMRGNLANWNQAITFGSRPSLNQAFLKATNYDSSWKRPFVVQSGANPMILDFQVNARVVRPMVKNAIPGLVDHH